MTTYKVLTDQYSDIIIETIDHLYSCYIVLKRGGHLFCSRLLRGGRLFCPGVARGGHQLCPERNEQSFISPPDR